MDFGIILGLILRAFFGFLMHTHDVVNDIFRVLLLSPLMLGWSVHWRPSLCCGCRAEDFKARLMASASLYIYICMRRIDICCGTIRTTSFGRSTAIGPLSTITRVVSKSWRKEGKLLVGCMVVTLAKQLQRFHVPSVIATDLQGHTMKNLVRVLVKKTPHIKKLQCR